MCAKTTFAELLSQTNLSEAWLFCKTCKSVLFFAPYHLKKLPLYNDLPLPFYALEFHLSGWFSKEAIVRMILWNVISLVLRLYVTICWTTL